MCDRRRRENKYGDMTRSPTWGLGIGSITLESLCVTKLLTSLWNIAENTFKTATSPSNRLQSAFLAKRIASYTLQVIFQIVCHFAIEINWMGNVTSLNDPHPLMYGTRILNFNAMELLRELSCNS